MNAVLRFLEGLRAETLECCANAVSSHAFDTRGGKSLQFSWAVLQPTMLLAKHGELRVFFLSFFFFYDVLETNLSFFEARSCRFTRWRILWILCRRVLLATFYKNRIFFFVFSFYLNPKRIPPGELIMLLKSRFRSFTRISLVEWRAVLISRSFLIIGDSTDSLATIQRKTEFTFR